MEERTTVPVTEFCHYHRVEISFIRSLHEYGLLQVDTINDEEWRLPQDELEKVERLVRLHYDLHINLEGIDVIHQLLQRMDGMQRELSAVRSRLRLYEGE
jgi:hypothetical protein